MQKLCVLLLVVSGCGEMQEYECCNDGTIEVCTCATDTLCAQQAFTDHGDGTCSTGWADAPDTGTD